MTGQAHYYIHEINSYVPVVFLRHLVITSTHILHASLEKQQPCGDVMLPLSNLIYNLLQANFVHRKLTLNICLWPTIMHSGVR